MLKEIFEQPEVLKNTLRGRIKQGKIKLTLDSDFNVIKRIILTACGTSWHSGLIGKYLIEKIAQIPVEVALKFSIVWLATCPKLSPKTIAS